MFLAVHLLRMIREFLYALHIYNFDSMYCEISRKPFGGWASEPKSNSIAAFR